LVLRLQYRWFSLGSIDTGVPRENHRHWHWSTQRKPPGLTPEYPERTTGIDTRVPRQNHQHNTGGSLLVLRLQYRWFSLGTPVSIPVVLSRYFGVNAGDSLWVLRCQCRWFSLGNPMSMPVVLSGYSGVNSGGSLWVIRCQCRCFSLCTPVSGIDTGVPRENHRH
jgi:hypothetical protein